MYFKILDSVSSVEKKISLAISEEANKRIRKNLIKVKPEVQSFIGDSIINQPEMVSLVGGYLRGAFGLVTPETAVDSIMKSVLSSVYVDFRKYNDKLRGGLTVKVQPSDFGSLLNLPEGHVIYSKGDLHWLRWLLEYGDTIIVANYDYNPQTGLGRSSLGNMKDGTGFRVPPEFSGTLTNNFITRALTEPQQEQRIYNILKKGATLSELKGFNSVFETTLNNEIQDNLVEFLDYGLLEKGNYFNVTLGETSSNGFDYSKLNLSSTQSYSSGRAWEGFRKNWVWQSGISGVDGADDPIVGTNNSNPGISGVYVDGTFYPSDSTGTYAHHVDYFNGRVIFDNPIPTGSNVQAEFSYKYINVIYANSLPWLREIQYRSLDLNSTVNSDFTLPSEMRVQLPAIAIEVVPRRTFAPYQLGGGQYVRTDVLFHCLAEDEITRNTLVDIISQQNDKSIFLFDNDSLAKSGDFPPDYRGVPVSGALRYPEIVQKHFDIKMSFKDSNVQGMELINSNFYAGIVRVTMESVRRNI